MEGWKFVALLWDVIVCCDKQPCLCSVEVFKTGTDGGVHNLEVIVVSRSKVTIVELDLTEFSCWLLSFDVEKEGVARDNLGQDKVSFTNKSR